MDRHRRRFTVPLSFPIVSHFCRFSPCASLLEDSLRVVLSALPHRQCIAILASDLRASRVGLAE
ncbi:hypothetical protein [Edwardsiella tarda]|uniref:hypothetical protein n=1 Tax=Edwardsiella tarda TaxID=636 RepID=UPI0030819359|nr:hypothetical protein GBS0709_17790 [Edwardsiella tarda]